MSLSKKSSNCQKKKPYWKCHCQGKVITVKNNIVKNVIVKEK